MKTIFFGVGLLLLGFLGWTVPISSGKTIIYLNFMCNLGNEHFSQEQGLSCSSLSMLTYAIYALLGMGLIVSVTSAFHKNKNSITK